MALHPAGNVIAQIIEGEAVVINLDNGSYFTFNGSGSDVWAGVEAGADADAIAAHLHRRYALDAIDATAAATHFLRELQSEGLVIDDGAPGAAIEPQLTPPGPYDEPALERFDDMQDLILLDPVHEVDEQQGWPHRREDVVVNDARA